MLSKENYIFVWMQRNFCCLSGLYPNPALSKTHLCFPNMTSKLLLSMENFAREFFKSLIYSMYLLQQLHELGISILSCMVEE